MKREQIQQQHQQQNATDQDEISIAQQNSEVNQELLGETDDLLAEIDGLLEENAEDFVKGFVQKGGQ
ncbi:ubiquitin-like protein Pup [Rothia amarae]|uniref:Prokaryotic ubiquitin-like protein Pup n=1 Tax=Rothia amarae TaxID=169480 RepID=A0A7H2BH88_9MICC|nr:ubiquitin-like protein Pup [Rothia amarae]QNV39034.1 ubiquitin-like protein Pup [Rothia amarae]SIL09718.1 ubiquitin-like protein Pup [Mycobacteroides abscessus subsp. abscessus]